MANSRVFKYPLQICDEVAVALPKGAEVLAVQAQAGAPCLWARVNPSLATEQRVFRIAGTGHDLGHDDDMLTFVGTFQLLDGAFVFHVFEVSRHD